VNRFLPTLRTELPGDVDYTTPSDGKRPAAKVPNPTKNRTSSRN